MELTVTVNQTIESTYNVFLPHFRKIGDNHFFKVKSENEVLCVRLDDEIGKSYLNVAFMKESKSCDESEFNEAFNQTLKTLQEWN